MRQASKSQKKNKIRWHYSVESSKRFLSFRNARVFDESKVISLIDSLKNSNDEICFVVPDRKSFVGVSIYGYDKDRCKIERVAENKCGSYWLVANREIVKKLIVDLRELTFFPEKFGLVFKPWE